MRKVISKPDYTLLGILTVIILLGILILSSVSAPFSASFTTRNFGQPQPTYFLFHQIIYGLLLGLILGFIAYKIDLSLLKKYSLVFLLINLVFMGMLFVTNFSSQGTARWLSLGPISFQPSELLKITFLLYLSSWLTSRTKKVYNKRGLENINNLGQTLFAFLVIMGLISIFLILQPDISTLGVIISVALLVYFCANTPWWHSVFVVSIGLTSLFALIKLSSYRMDRFLVFLNPGMDPMGRGYQIQQALIAIGSGRINGSGLGLGLQKFGFLPEVMSDSIFAVFAEETGFIGAIILILLFLTFLWRGLWIVKNNNDKFSQFLAMGITSWIVIQAFVNIGAMIGILPLTGIPLPFISYGGSHLVVELIGMGILLNISKK